MTDQPETRNATPSDADAIRELYPQAFPNEDLLPLIEDLLPHPAASSLVAVHDGQIIGHICFTDCGVSGSPHSVSLLAPLAVAPEWQHKGIGTALVHTGLQRLADSNVASVCVLGDPAYYGRFGFKPETSIQPPYPLPEQWRSAWQSIDLSNGTASIEGKLLVPSPWRNPRLWSE